MILRYSKLSKYHHWLNYVKMKGIGYDLLNRFFYGVYSFHVNKMIGG